MALTHPPEPDVLRDPEVDKLLNQPDHQGLELPHSRQVYTNRSMSLEDVHLVGFDMDYTLAVYSMRQIEELAFRMTLERLLQTQGYPGGLVCPRFHHRDS